MSKIANAIDYYDIFLEKYTKDKAISLLKANGFTEYDYDPISNSIAVRSITDPTMIFSDMRWRENQDQYELVW